jgi:hypothetical protein
LRRFSDGINCEIDAWKFRRHPIKIDVTNNIALMSNRESLRLL